jgi:hypothetical protein
MAIALSSPDMIEDPDNAMPPWVLLIFKDADARLAARTEWETAGFNVEVALSDEDAAGFLAVMTPSLIVVDGAVYRPDRR